MFLTNIDTITMALFLASGIISVTLLGMLSLFLFKYEHLKVLLMMLIKFVLIALIATSFHIFVFFFKKPELSDFLIFGFMITIGVVVCLRLFLVFRQFINFWWVLTIIFLAMIDLVAFILQLLVNKDWLALMSGVIGLSIVTNIHFLALSVLIKLQK